MDKKGGKSPSQDEDVPISVVLAIDIGTARSGVAHAFVRNPDCVESDQMWPMHGGTMSASLKTRSAVLLTSDKKFVAFGDLATHKYLSLEPDAQQSHLYFDHFKMALYHNKTEVVARNGKKMPVLEVFAHAIRHLKEHALERLKSVSANAVCMEDIRWVLTVPAIWSESAKSTMVQAAGLAGLPHVKFMIALESEAAAVCCRSQEAKLTEGLNKPGTKFVVLDLGGGTADVTCHMTRNTNTVTEVAESDGNDCGSWKIDQAFVRWLEEAFGQQQISAYRSSQPADFLELQNAFETAKHMTSDKCTDCRINLPHSFIADFPQSRSAAAVPIWPPAAAHDKKSPHHAQPPTASLPLTASQPNMASQPVPHAAVASAAQLMPHAAVAPGGVAPGALAAWADPWDDQELSSWELVDEKAPIVKPASVNVDAVLGVEGLEACATVYRGVLRLSRGLMLKFFVPLLRELVTKMDEILAKVGPSHLFVVGGFAESAVVWTVLKELAKKHKVTAIRPSRPSLAVLTGAVQFGLAPSIIQSRVIKKTFGIAVSCEYNPLKHAIRKPSYRCNDGQAKAFCDGIFSPFVIKGDTCPVDKSVSQIYSPGEDNQDCMILKLFQSDSRAPTYVDAADSKQIAVMTIDMPDFTGNISRQVRVTLFFGATEIRAVAQDLTSGQEKTTRIHFQQNTLETIAHEA